MTIVNHHVAECGSPPLLKDDKYTCYFQNMHGEQLIMQYCPRERVCMLYSGDAGWDEPLIVENFHGHMIVRYAKRRESVFEHDGDFLVGVYRKLIGRELTREECDYLSHNLCALGKDEMQVIRAYWAICQRLV